MGVILAGEQGTSLSFSGSIGTYPLKKV